MSDHPLDHILQIIRLQAESVHTDIISGCDVSVQQSLREVVHGQSVFFRKYAKTPLFLTPPSPIRATISGFLAHFSRTYVGQFSSKQVVFHRISSKSGVNRGIEKKGPDTRKPLIIRGLA